MTPKHGDGQAQCMRRTVCARAMIGTVQDRASYDRTGKMDNHVHIEIRDKSGKVVDPTPRVKEWKK